MLRRTSIFVFALFLFAPQIRAQESAVSFNRDVRSILSGKCFQCHGPDAAHREADLRLDTREGATAKLGDHAAIVPGDLASSELIRRITSTDPSERMPPADSGKELTPQEIETLKKWIASGAEYESHWAFLPVRSPLLPDVDQSTPLRNEIDRFIAAKLKSNGLSLSEDADKATLLRRVHFDLIGLPPSPEEVSAFLNDPSEDAYEMVVRRLLQSPHYGERWGRHWLDQARYADSHGYTIDGDRPMWPYRDWVIRALNDDMPFDQFTIEQLAGDLLPSATRAQQVATGFHRNTLINQEGGTDPEQFRIEAVMDRVATTGAVWLGLTVGCAQCHTHKFDPISHREYYSLYAFFNSGADINDVGPSVEVHEGELFLADEHGESRRGLELAMAEVATLLSQREARKKEWIAKSLASINSAEPETEATWSVPKIASVKAEQAELKILEDQSILATPGIPRESYIVETEPIASQTRIRAIRLRVLTHDSLPKKGPGLASNGNFVLTALEAYLGDSRIPLETAAADHYQNNFPPEKLIDDDPGTGWAINVSPGASAKLNADHEVILGLAHDLTSSGQKLRFILRHELNNDYNVGRFEIAISDQMPSSGGDMRLREAIDLPEEKRSADHKKLIDSAFASQDEPLKQARAKIDAERKKLGLGSAVKTMTMRDASQRRPTYLLKRGNFLSPDKEGGEITPDTLAVLPPLPPTEAQNRNRLDLARWLVSRDNPLTPRVTVNRIWMHYFGRGIVETENDFGSQGSLPTHPELLDYLASQFMTDGWSLKKLHYLIATSATYRQSSNARPDATEKDPLNLLLARQNRLRFDAEIIRDAALAASGKLSRKIGGPSVHPPQPEGVYSFTQNKKVWRTSTGEDRFRRALYTTFYRSAPYPLLTTFDSPDFQSTCTRRTRSNTPLQALTMANDASLFELAQALAARVIVESPQEDDPSARIRRLYLAALSREPSDKELEIMKAFVARQVGNPAEIWTGVVRAVMNTDEFVTRE
jgi:mono/diheme cytochrome c family protein